MKHYLKLSSILFFLFLFGCKGGEKQKPKDLLPEDKFISVMIDVQIAEAINMRPRPGEPDSGKTIYSFYKEIFDKHEVNREDFEKTYDYYSSDPSEMRLIFESVLDSLNKLDVEIKQVSAPAFRADSLMMDSVVVGDSIVVPDTLGGLD